MCRCCTHADVLPDEDRPTRAELAEDARLDSQRLLPGTVKVPVTAADFVPSPDDLPF